MNAAGAGWYQFADLNPLMQRNVYRLSMVDLDGSVAYSPLVEISNPDPAPFLVTVHEADKEILIHWQIDAGEVELRLIDITGRTVMSESVNTSAGLDQTIRVPSLPAGWYHLQVISREPIAGKSVILR